ncbi:Glutamyl-tRNA(Gln) amidotransferase subunit D [Wickerhamomyces ciferrii]|uniref:asparaginase n=1 Tax=Wickerhamomyces ciferrii (strain ATCC 14091 / BCRC 22168 / CBS 111 / JCM 3599 / NBRC 0793 / NRRL Y-1031 F-60-10) TaxID=1206466 RepID=K0KWF2_WICCF|nr:Glutamyl-tRNA(Gln) amidotransferase subunit D [Wickerhamomyces ciferrii]CCH46297.1 Glutamyl-tRNA(Gln) amidotransferase subunit D [Wickerhamomyces ciferrii]
MPNQEPTITTSTSNEIDIDSHDNSLPVVKILGTGGTIASKGTTNTQTAGYKVDLNIEDLVKSVPDLANIAHLKYQQIVNLDSKEINSTHLLLLHREIKKSYLEEGIKSFVITHGTDSLEETAFFLELTVSYPDIVIVITGSMRPHSSISSDGSFNLYQAVAVSANEKSKGRGVLVVLNDSIGSGFYITKSNANSLDTFKSIGQGYLGSFVDNEVHYYYPPSKPFPKSLSFEIDSERLTRLLQFSSNPDSAKRRHEFPEVTILYNYQGFNPQLIELAAQQMDSKALVFACSGAGSLTDETNEILKWVWHKYNIPVVYSKRSMDGTVPRASLPKNDNGEVYKGAIAGGYLNPQKCRILLQLALNQGYNVSQIKSIFESGGIYGG